MDDRHRISLRLARETTKHWSADVLPEGPTFKSHEERGKFTTAAAVRLRAAVGLLSCGQPITPPVISQLLGPSRQLETLGARLGWLRRRLHMAVPDDHADGDLARDIRGAHDEIGAALNRVAFELTFLEKLTWELLAPLTANGYDAAAAAACGTIESVPSAPATLDFCAALLLVAAGAVPPPANNSLARALEHAENHGLLPADHLIGLPDFTSRVTSKTIAGCPQIKVRLPTIEEANFASLADLFRSENRCANALLETFPDREAAQRAIEFQIRLTIIESLLAGWMSLRGFVVEAEACLHGKDMPPEHLQLLASFAKQSAALETRTLALIHIHAGAGWAYVPDFFAALDPLLSEVKKRIASDPETDAPLGAMVQYLQALRILPLPEQVVREISLKP